jgi:sugar phosphate isomerase/epimerase
MTESQIKVGCQLNCWQRELDLRSAAWETLDAALTQLRESGFRAVEVPSWSVPSLAEPERLKEACARADVTLVSLHVGGPFFEDATYHDQTLDRVLPVAKCAAKAGAEAVVVSHATMNGKVDGFGTDAGRQGAAWRSQVTNVADLARRVRDLGIQAWFHNHDAHFEHNAWEMDSLLEADPQVVQFCLDVGHASQAIRRDGLLAWLDRNWDRIRCLHYKDVAGPLAGPVVEALGDGDVEFQAISAAAIRQKFDGWIVAELDVGQRNGRTPVRSSLEDARRSFEVIRGSLIDKAR